MMGLYFTTKTINYFTFTEKKKTFLTDCNLYLVSEFRAVYELFKISDLRSAILFWNNFAFSRLYPHR